MVYKNMEEAVEIMFFEQVLGTKPKKLKPATMLSDFCPDKKFEKEFLRMYIDRAQRVFGVSLRNLQSKPMTEIFAFLVTKKKRDALYGADRPYKVKK